MAPHTGFTALDFLDHTIALWKASDDVRKTAIYVYSPSSLLTVLSKRVKLKQLSSIASD